MNHPLMAFDKSMRSIDADGRLHVETTNISKAAVNPYMGREIPNWQELGLDGDKVYHLLRHPDELERAAPTFNNLPVLSKHVPVTADEHHPDLVVGSTGTDAEFVDGFLRNSMVIWAAPSIEKVESEEQRELSSAYRYTPDMTAGVWEGVAYDGIMRDIVGNHVALVDEGRAGPDVIVADRKPNMLKTRMATMLHGALAAHVAPKLAQDSAVDIAGALKGLPNDAKKIAAAFIAAAKPKLAQDEGLDVDDVCKVIEAVQGEAVALDEEEELEIKEEIAEDEDSPREDVIADLMDYLKDRMSPEDYEHAASMVRREATMDEDLKPGGPADGPAMDRATVASMIAKAKEEGAREQAAINQAYEDVKPLVGKLIGMDSASSIYQAALKSVGYDDKALKGASTVTLKAMCDREASIKGQSRVAMDHAKVKDKRASFNERFGVK